MAVTARRPHGRYFALLAIVTVLLQSENAHADHVERLSQLRHEQFQQQARLEAAEEEARRITPARIGGAAVRDFQDPSVVLNELRPALADDYKNLRIAAGELAMRARLRGEETHKQWEHIYRERIEFRHFAEQRQRESGFDFKSGTHTGFKLTLIDAAALAWIVVIFLVARRLGRHVRRVNIRKVRRIALIAVIPLLFSVPGCTEDTTNEAPSWAAREEAAINAELTNTRAKADIAAAEADAKWTAALDSWAALIAAPGAMAAPVEQALREGENDVRASLQAAARDARLADHLTADAVEQHAALAAERARLDELTAGARWRSIGFTVGRFSGVALLFSLAVMPYWRALRNEASLIRADAKKCPRCFSEKLIVETTAPMPGGEEDSEEAEEEETNLLPRYRRGKNKSKSKKQAREAEPKETGYVECRACTFRFLRSYQNVRRLCFPAVGVRNSGKTHMLATGYDRVRKQTAPTVAVIQPAPSLGDARFEQYIDLILNLKREAGGTVHAMPDPVMLHVRDADREGPNTALVNLFDYSGELVNQAIDKDRLKKQAVKMDGFMMFLDPTQLYGDGANVTLDRQLNALNEFMADMREARGVPVGQVIPVPVAVCITKFDLLTTENPIQAQAVPFIRKLLTKWSPPPKQTSLAVLQGRSELVEGMLTLMFRGVEVRALVESYFGPRVMFFPVSSVSLFENELGIRDLSKRTIAPFGVAEPFLWLLYMHGYEVLGS